jgi:chorismate mutase
MGALATLGIQAGLAGGQYLLDRRAQNKAFEQNKQFWHERFDKEAKYNSPVQQKARMQEAGLSPALMYKGGQTGGNVSGGSAQGKIAERAQLTELARMSAEVAKIKADTAKTNTERAFIASKTEGQGTQNAIAVKNLSMAGIKEAQYSKQLTADLMKTVNEITLLGQKIESEKQMTGLTFTKKAMEQEMLNKYRKLYKTAVENGIDIEAGWFQTLKMFMMNTAYPAMKQLPTISEMRMNMMNPGMDIFGNQVK